jgi:hypothetical protein
MAAGEPAGPPFRVGETTAVIGDGAREVARDARARATGARIMDESRFDALARHVGRLTTRRATLRRLSGAILALGLVSRVDPAVARKDCRLVGEPCGTGPGNPGRCCRGAVCTEGQLGGGTCVCPEHLQACRGSCVDSASNREACGPNCEICPDDADCCEGACCREGQRCCDGKCTDLTSDNDHCGGCGQFCPQGLTCCDARCRAFADDPRHCGGCGKACGENETCVNSACVCRPGYADCGDGICRSLRGDPRNCGRCDRACGFGQACRGGRCKCTGPYARTCAPREPFRCGLPEDRLCAGEQECCQGACIEYGGARRCRPCLGASCLDDVDCCGNLRCNQSPGPAEFAKFCGGCRGRRETCSVNEQCCSSACTPDTQGSTCLSSGGGRCQSDFDCRDCFVNGNCEGACTGGRCRA